MYHECRERHHRYDRADSSSERARVFLMRDEEHLRARTKLLVIVLSPDALGSFVLSWVQHRPCGTTDCRSWCTDPRLSRSEPACDSWRETASRSYPSTLSSCRFSGMDALPRRLCSSLR